MSSITEKNQVDEADQHSIEIANRAAQAVITKEDLGVFKNETPIQSLSWALGTEIDHEKGLGLLVEETLRIVAEESTPHEPQRP